MKLYATATSERASSGQGGNQYLDIVLLVEHPNKTRQTIGKFALTAGNEKNQMFSLVYIDEDGGITTIKKIKHNGTAKNKKIKRCDHPADVSCVYCNQDIQQRYANGF